MDDIILHGLEVPHQVLPRPSPDLLVTHFKVTSETQINQTFKDFCQTYSFAKAFKRSCFKQHEKKANQERKFTMNIYTRDAYLPSNNKRAVK